jgi:endonuclease/exonuclease/phosphatase family metal-dependent hydrolase
MAIRVGTFNCENLFSRSRIIDLGDSPEEQERASAAIKAADELRKVLNKTTYTKADKKNIRDLLEAGRGFFTLEKDRGKLMAGNQVVANGAADFLGHIKFIRGDISGTAIRNTGRVIKELNADILCIVEVEDRQLLGHFNSKVLTSKRFINHMVVDGNDDRGIDVGILSKKPLKSIRTHVNDRDEKGQIFSRDCAEYEMRLDDGRSLWVLCNHFKSKGFGLPGVNDARRKRQAARVAKILEEEFDLTKDLVVIAGDLNDAPVSPPLSPLLSVSDLHNVVDTLPVDGRFTHIFKKERNQIDYLLVSTPLRDALKSVTIERRGMFSFADRFSSITRLSEEASDHAGVVAEFSI